MEEMHCMLLYGRDAEAKPTNILARN